MMSFIFSLNDVFTEILKSIRNLLIGEGKTSFETDTIDKINIEQVNKIYLLYYA